MYIVYSEIHVMLFNNAAPAAQYDNK